MKYRHVIIFVFLLVIIFANSLFPMSTITNYRTDSILTFDFNRSDVDYPDAILYNVEPYVFGYIGSWCPFDIYPCEDK